MTDCVIDNVGNKTGFSDIIINDEQAPIVEVIKVDSVKDSTIESAIVLDGNNIGTVKGYTNSDIKIHFKLN